MVLPRALDVDRLAELARWSTPPCASMYVPLDPLNADASRIALKDALRDARRQLAGWLHAGPVSELLAPFDGFERHLGTRGARRGVALLAAPDFAAAHWIDDGTPEVAAAGNRFVITPLVAALPLGGRMHVLALGQHNVRLFRSTSHGLTEINVPGLPHRLDDALWYEDPEQRISWHGGARVGAGSVAPVTHGAGSERDVHTDRLWRFFRAVDDAIAGALNVSKGPLLVAGLEHQLDVYRQASRLHGIETLDVGSTDALSATELWQRCGPVVTEMLDRPRRARLHELLEASERATTVDEVMAACAQSRVDALFVRPDRLQWSASGNSGELHESPEPGDVELHSVAIDAALRQGAAVFPAWAGELPDDESLGASLRF